MSLIDLAKSAKRKSEQWLTAHPVVFHHVPKCGGTSVGRALRQRYLLSQATVTPEASFRAFEAFTGRSDREQMLVDVLDLREQMLLYLMFEEVRCVSLHVRFSIKAYELFSSQYKFITILRDPVERFISHYYWSYGKPGAHARIEDDLPAFLETDRARRMGAMYVEFFCGLPKDADIRSDKAIAAAIANLERFDVVGRLDDLPRFQGDLKTALGVGVRIGHQNKSRSPSAQKIDQISPTHLEAINNICEPDLNVWNKLFILNS